VNKYSICIVDDKIPAHAVNMNDGIRLNSNNLEYLKNNVTDWDDVYVKEFVKNLLNKSDWSLSGFTYPTILINCLEEELYRPDIVIFDWEYPGTPFGSDLVEESLLTILQYSFSIVFIFTGVDKQDEIRELLEHSPLAEYANRVNIKSKLDENSTQVLYEDIEKIRKQSFSFKFGAEMRKKSLEALEKILIELGKVTLEETVDYFKLSGDTSKDLIDFIGERFKNHLSTSQFKALPEEAKGVTNPDTEIARQLWSHRLYFYHNESDKIVRKGDIIEKDNEFFVVVTADCDLARFWHKNYGYINLLPIYEVQNDNEYIIRQATMTRKKSKVKSDLKVNSFSDDIGNLPGVLLLPFLKFDDDFKDFVLFPKELMNKKIEIQKDSNPIPQKDRSLKYNEGFEFNKVATISEPFLTPLIQHIFSTISGYGTPDYPATVADLISKNFGKIFE